MENNIVRCQKQIKKEVVEYYQLFNYELQEEKEYLFGRIKLTFSRNESSNEVKEVEGKYRLSPFLTFYPLILGCLLIVVLTTLFLIFGFKGEDRWTYFLAFMLPVFLLLPLMALYTYLRFKCDNKNVEILSNLNNIKKELEG